MGLYSRGLIIGGIFASEIWRALIIIIIIILGGGGRGAYYRNFTVFSSPFHLNNVNLFMINLFILYSCDCSGNSKVP